MRESDSAGQARQGERGRRGSGFDFGTGLCVLVGATHADAEQQTSKIARKIAQLRILRNTEGEDDPALRVSAEESHAPIC